MVLDQHREVVFADLDVLRDVPWVSLRAIPGIIPKIAGAIQVQIPEALILGAPVQTVSAHPGY